MKPQRDVAHYITRAMAPPQIQLNFYEARNYYFYWEQFSVRREWFFKERGYDSQGGGCPYIEHGLL